MRLISLLALATLASCAAARAQDVETIGRYVNDTTLLVVWLDIEAVDSSALFDEARRVIGRSTVTPPPGEAISTAEETIESARQTLLESGATQIALLVGMPGMAEPPVLLVVPHTGDGAAIRAFASDLPHVFSQNVEQREGVVLAGRIEAFGGGGGRVDELDRALTDVTGASLRIGFVPASYTRRVLQEMRPRLPEALGAGPMTTLTRGIEWAAAGVRLPPRGAVDVVIQSEDAKSATEFAALINRAFELARSMPEIAAEFQQFEALVSMLTPKQQGARLTLSLDSQAVGLLEDEFYHRLSHARRRALDMQSAHNIRMVLLGCHTYAAMHQDDWPTDLNVLIADGIIAGDILTNPNRSGDGYTYVQPDREAVRDAQGVVMYEEFETWPDRGIWVGFVDGHVERVGDREEFNQLLR